jgi:hypothetical protein
MKAVSAATVSLGLVATASVMAQQAAATAPQAQGWTTAIAPYAPHIAITSLAVALGTLIWRFVEFVVGRRDRSRDLIGDIRDGFWFQEVVFPACVKPIIDSTLSVNERLRKLDELIANPAAGETEDHIRMRWLQEFQHDHRAQVVRCLMLDVVWDGAYKVASKHLDEIDDLVTQHVMCSKLPVEPGAERTYQVRSKIVQECYGRLKLLLDALYQKQKSRD